MKIAFLTTLNPEDANTWSGTLYHILQTLLKSHDVKIVGQNMLAQALNFVKGNISSKRDMREYSPVFGNCVLKKWQIVTLCSLAIYILVHSLIQIFPWFI